MSGIPDVTHPVDVALRPCDHTSLQALHICCYVPSTCTSAYRCLSQSPGPPNFPPLCSLPHPAAPPAPLSTHHHPSFHIFGDLQPTHSWPSSAWHYGLQRPAELPLLLCGPLRSSGHAGLRTHAGHKAHALEPWLKIMPTRCQCPQPYPSSSSASDHRAWRSARPDAPACAPAAADAAAAGARAQEAPATKQPRQTVPNYLKGWKRSSPRGLRV